MEDWTSLGQHKRHPEFPVVTRESRCNSRKSTWFPRHRKMKPFPATVSQEKSHVRYWRSKRYLAPLMRPTKCPDIPVSLKRNTGVARTARIVDIDDQVEATRRIFASDTLWTVVRGSDLEEGESQGLPVWSRHVGDPVLESNLTRRVDFALFMVEALGNDALIHEAPAIVGRRTPSALAHVDSPAG